MKLRSLTLATALLAIFLTSATAQTSITNGLVAYYLFNGNADDASGHGNNGTAFNGASYIPSTLGSAASFSGSSQYITLPNTISNDEDLSVTFWVNTGDSTPNGFPYGEFLVSRDISGYAFDWNICLGQGRKIDFVTDADELITPLDIGSNTWVQVACVADPVNQEKVLFVNGVAVVSASWQPFAFANNSVPIFLGASSVDTTSHAYLTGALADVRIYNRALTTNDVQTIYGAENPDHCTPPRAGIISWWPAEGNAFDQVGTNSGALIGPVIYTNGEVGQAFKFDGASSYVQIPDSPSLNPAGPFSIEGWIYPTQDGDQKIFSKWGDQGSYGDNRSYGFSTIPGLGLSFSISDLANQENGAFHTFTTTNGVLATNAWNHVAATYDSTTGIRCIYVNGVTVAAMTNAPVAVYAGIAPVTIGAWLRAPGTSQDYFQGLIDEMSFYGRVLSATEIQAIYSAGSGGKCNFQYYTPPPRTATGTAMVTNGFVVDVNMTDNGAGYTNTPLVRFIGGGTGVQAFAVVSNGMVVAINVLNPGSGYADTTVVVIDPPFISNPILGIASISVLNFSNLTIGTNYQLQRFQSPNWINQSVSFKAVTTVYTQMVAGVPDSGDYRLAVTPVPARATAIPQLVNGFVVGAVVINGGSGYVTPPAVAIVANMGSNATAVATITNGRVTKITITNAGIGYVNPVTIQIDPPPANALAPTVTPGVAIKSSSLAPYDNYQIQFKSEFGTLWSNLNGGLFSPTAATNSQYIFLTNNTGFFRLQFVP